MLRVVECRAEEKRRTRLFGRAATQKATHRRHPSGETSDRRSAVFLRQQVQLAGGPPIQAGRKREQQSHRDQASSGTNAKPSRTMSVPGAELFFFRRSP